MNVFENPALKAFVHEIQGGLAFAQLWLCREEKTFRLCHVDNQGDSFESLRIISKNDLRVLAQFTADGAFRPLKSAPTLQTGWGLFARDEAELELILNTVYPGGLADWFAVRFANALPTHYREYTNRQTGMYRITAMLTDPQAAPMIRACCHKKFCLKQRLWTVPGLETDSSAEKSLIPCPEPCAILLEFARKAMRLVQQDEKGEASKPELAERDGEIREADFENSQNPRRLQLVREKEKIEP